MTYVIAPLFVRPWTLNGISPRLIESHYEVNYGGTVQRLNAITEQLAFLDRTTTPAEVIHRLKRDEFTALNSMLLHELYFASLGGDGRAVPAEMTAALTRDFGTVNRWRDEFIGLAELLAADAEARLGAADLRAARRPPDQSRRNRRRPYDCRRHSSARPRHVRARLSHRFRRQCNGLYLGLHAQHRMEGGGDTHTQRHEGRAAAEARAARVW